MNLIDMDGLQLRPHHQPRALRHEIQDRLARPHHLAECEHLHAVDLARNRRPDRHALQPPPDLCQTLAHLVLPRLNLAVLFLRLLNAPRPDLEHLALDLGDAAAYARDPGRDVASLAVEARRLALEFEQMVELGQAFLEQRALRFKLATDEGTLARHRIGLRLQPRDLVVRLADRFPDLRGLPRPG